VPKEPWRVLTSLPEADATFAVYYSRMLVEEFFRDDKYWLDLEKSGIGRDWRGGKEQVRLSPFRLERLLVGLQGAYLAWATLGEEPQVQAVAGRLRRSRTAQERQAKRPPRLSRISLALLALRYPWHVPEQAFLQAWERLRALLTWAGQGTSPVPVRAPPDREKPPLFLTHPRLAMIYHEELLSVKCPGGPPGF
jgi:hypothetical protein